MSITLQPEEENNREEGEGEDQQEHETSAGDHVVVRTTNNEHVAGGWSGAFHLKKPNLHLRHLLGPLGRRRSQQAATMPTGILCGFRPFPSERKNVRPEVVRGQSSKRREKKNSAPRPKQNGSSRGGSTGLVVLMMDLRKKIIQFRDVFDLPACDVSAFINKLVTETMSNLHSLYPEILPIKDLSEIKEGASIHEVLIYLCGALRSVGDAWVTTSDDDEWMDKSTSYKQNNMDELNSEQLVELALATLDCLIKISYEKFEHVVADEDEEDDDHSHEITSARSSTTSRCDLVDHHEKVLVGRSYSESSNTPFTASSSPVNTPTSVLPELTISCASSPKAEEFSTLYCSSPFLRLLSFQAVGGKLSRLDVKHMSFHLFPHGGSGSHHHRHHRRHKGSSSRAKSHENVPFEMDGSQKDLRTKEHKPTTGPKPPPPPPPPPRWRPPKPPPPPPPPFPSWVTLKTNNVVVPQPPPLPSRATLEKSALPQPPPLPTLHSCDTLEKSALPQPPPLPNLPSCDTLEKCAVPQPPPLPNLPSPKKDAVVVPQQHPLLTRSPPVLKSQPLLQPPPPPPPPRAASIGSGSSKAPPPSPSKDGPPPPAAAAGAPPPPPPGATKLLRPKKAHTKLKRSSQMGNLYRLLKGKVEGGNQVKSQRGRVSSGSGNSGGGKQGMADALAEITRRSAYFQQIEEDVHTYAEEITKLKKEISSFKTKDMVLSRFEGFPEKKLEAVRSAAALYCKLKGIVTDLQTWKIESPLDRLLDRIERYFNKAKGDMDAFERNKEEDCKRFKNHNIEFDLQILVQIKEAVERKIATSNGGQPSKTCCKTLWRAFQFAFRVYTFAGGHDDRADRLTKELAQQIEEDHRRMQEAN
ncbi:unnamed protein product [Linum tenue]|uniref:Hydroxyproline-rich glycoprotein family protein n=1 Tax=Linum tenue TaxID=586396 RepID=A0AAV0PBE1_9ROSI|nr:unnamed protein product [Linum tenue]